MKQGAGPSGPAPLCNSVRWRVCAGAYGFSKYVVIGTNSGVGQTAMCEPEGEWGELYVIYDGINPHAGVSFSPWRT